ncbi:transcriptional regulator family: Fungal Specific TF [Penicillium roqueforti]|nr:transcriptional regulator family: Fungal Specific TF [Penicillium roqueforti]KAI2741321.1 transcriptional regulator family: Fungal Specific TF [Penicillium roqueforti]KAI2769238.1 transcriptional regulator family: Fungal Specific TF [Penicillium roqueforti]KAI3082801.1 transcriptional regulator family: Fungal Specific TF [Penicillium roqueforti]KAI3089187.1 transcriptional regulator family: Fungal Specific TF [Penicillium roqueforti]
MATSLTQTSNPRRVYTDTKHTIQMSTSRFKPIQPYTPATKPLISDQRGKPPVRDHLIRRLSAACKECQRRRTKCSSENPCLECTKRGSICVFDMSSDKRRKSHASKIEAELRHYQRFLNDFLRAIQDSGDDDVRNIINTVRAGSSTSEIQSEVNSVLMRNYYSRSAL